MAKSSGFMKKVGSKVKKAVEKHREDDTRADAGGSLPPGIEGGIAQLTECGFDVVKEGKQNAGEYYWYAAGIVKRPLEHDGVPVEGMRTSIMEMVCDTPGRSRETVDDHIDWIMNEMRKLGIDTTDVEAEDLEEVCEQLREAQPYFRFRTWVGKKQTTGPYKDREPRVQEVWQGAVDFEEGEVEDDVEEEEEDDAEEEVDLSELATLADDEEDEDAIEKLEELATEAGMNSQEYDTWADLVAALEEADEEAEDEEVEEEEEDDEEEEVDEEEEEEEEEWKPEKGEEWGYKPPKSRKAVTVVVTSVNAGKETCNLKDEEGTTYKAVNWSELQELG